MKILVFPHDLEIGGSQLNAIEIAAAVQDRGHDVLMFGVPGELNGRIEELGLEFIAAPRPSLRPTPSIVRALQQLTAERGLDVLHGYEWPPTLECLLAARSTEAVAVSTVMSMSVAPFIPRHVPLMVGTQDILSAERHFGRTHTELLEPPVDLRENNPVIDVGVESFRRQWGLQPESFVVSIVSRLAAELKLEGILAAIEAVGMVGHQIPVQLVIAGDGAGRESVETAARAVNASLARAAVVVTGQLSDPRPAYAAADLVLGMGGSALRAMSFAKPLIVQGEQGFWELLTPQTLPLFLRQGWFGIGTDACQGPARIADLLRDTYSTPIRRSDLAAFSLKTVTENFSLTRAAELQEDLYRRSLAAPKTNRLPENLAATGRFLKHQAGQRIQEFRGTKAVDDFNSRLAGKEPAQQGNAPAAGSLR